MPSLTVFNIRFTPSWPMSMLALFAIIFFTHLGFWQLHRAEEKKQMLSAYYQSVNCPPVIWQSYNKRPTQYQQIKIEGHFLPHVFLLDNQHYNHQFGYNVLSPFVLANGQVILVDRGWVAGDITRQHLPKIVTPVGRLWIKGHVYYPDNRNWLLGPVLEKEQSDTAVIELIDFKIIRQFLHKSVYPFIIRLNPEEGHGYVRKWAIVSMPPQRHNAYALQWFLIAFVILVLFVALNIHKIKR